MLHTGTTEKSFFKGVKYLSHWLTAQTPEDLSDIMNLFWDEQTGWLNRSDTRQCNALNRVCFTCWHCHERAPSVCPVLSDNQAVQNLQPHARVSCGISAWGRARVPHPPRRDKGLDTEFKSTDVSFTPASWVQNVQIHSYSLTKASKWFLACIISAPKRGREKKAWQYQHFPTTVTQRSKNSAAVPRTAKWSPNARWRPWRLPAPSSGLNARLTVLHLC